MLFDFHQSQNAKQSKSVHATYLLTGKRRSPTQLKGPDRDGEDLVMRSSPFMSSMMDPEEVSEAPVQKMTVVLAREEELESAYTSSVDICF
jgi:DNA polymerase delta subunit 3